MDIAVISDQHLGYGWDTERRDDPFDNFREALERSRDADVILLPGDLFDRKIPRQEVLGRAIDLFKEFDDIESDVDVTDDGDKQFSFRGTPIIAIHGTHERRSSDFLNPIQLLEKAGYLCHLHNETIVLRKGDETLTVHGMSGVPERYAPKVLQRFDPTPVDGATNIFMLHQSIENFVYTDPDHPALKLEHLPEGFDYIIDGHIHWYNLEMRDADRPLVIPGSTVTTQINQTEADKPKGFLRIDTRDGLEFIELDGTRDVEHREIDVTGMTGSQVRDAVQDAMDEILDDREKKPLVRLVLTGETDAEISVTELREPYEDRALLTVAKRTATSNEEGQADVQYEEKNAREQGMAILQEKMDWEGLDDLFTLLSDGELDAAMDKLEATDPDDLQDAAGAEEEGKDGTAEDDEPEETGDGRDSNLEAFIQ
ncbi:MAG: DNA repair exonuclease [Candidatus Nanohaloarchaea archaeon]|nr:DNA repair exonuclease [Candidatus Nanohaloarchaea archaeon]